MTKLPDLTENDPQWELSDDARRRIARADLQGDVQRFQDLAQAESNDEDLLKGEARGKAKKARLVLTEMAREYHAVGKRGIEFRCIMSEALDEAAYALELSTIQKEAISLEIQLLEMELGRSEPTSIGASDEEPPPDVTEEAIAPERGSDRFERRNLVKQYQNECKAAGKKVTYADIAKEASPSWSGRTQVDLWVAWKDKPGWDVKIRRVLREKPHLAEGSSKKTPGRR